MKSLVGRNPAVSSTTVEATTNLAHHRRPSQKFRGPLRDWPFHHMEADVFLGAKLIDARVAKVDDAGGEGPGRGRVSFGHWSTTRFKD